MIFAQSIGPLDFWGRAVVKAFCGGIAAATVRDERSRRLLAALLPSVRVERTADPVFLLDPDRAPLDLAAEGLGGAGPIVIVSVRRWQHNEATIALLAAVVDRLANEHGAQVAFLPLGGAADADVSSTVIRRAKSAPLLLPDMSLGHAAQINRPRIARGRNALACAHHRSTARRAVRGDSLRSESLGTAG